MPAIAIENICLANPQTEELLDGQDQCPAPSIPSHYVDQMTAVGTAMENRAKFAYGRERTGYRIGAQMKSQWEALYDSLRADIELGTLAPGERLPTEHQLASRKGVSRNTVRRAYLALSQDGAIRSINGHGSYVMRTGITYEIEAGSRFRDILEQQGVTSTSRLVESFVGPADAELAKRLFINAGEPVLSHTAIIAGDGVPFILTTRYFPADLVDDFQQKLLQTGSFTRILREAALGELRRKSTTVGARLADEREAALLECPKNSPVLDVVASGALTGGRIVEWQQAVMNSRLIRLSFQSA